MKKLFVLASLLFVSTTLIAQDIYSDKFFYGYPKKIPPMNQIIIRDCYIASYNPDTKFSDWIACVVNKDDISKIKKYNLQEEPLLSEDDRLELDDYYDTFNTISYDKGELISVEAFADNSSWEDLTYLTNIVPQKILMNRWIWRVLDWNIRKFADKMDQDVYVISGCLYISDMRSLPAADEGHKVPSHFYKIISISNDEVGVRIFTLKIPQDAIDQDLSKYLCTVDELEYLTGYNFFWQLYDTVENDLEANIDLEGFNYFLKAQHIK